MLVFSAVFEYSLAQSKDDSRINRSQSFYISGSRVQECISEGLGQGLDSRAGLYSPLPTASVSPPDGQLYPVCI